jgi:hypothetical protein
LPCWRNAQRQGQDGHRCEFRESQKLLHHSANYGADKKIPSKR